MDVRASLRASRLIPRGPGIEQPGKSSVPPGGSNPGLALFYTCGKGDSFKFDSMDSNCGS